MTGRVNDVDTMLKGSRHRLAFFFQCPMACCRSGCDRDTTLLLLLHPVHCRRAFMRVADFVVYTGIVQDTLCQCCLTGINMSHDTDVSSSFQGVFSSCPSHEFLLL